MHIHPKYTPTQAHLNERKSGQLKKMSSLTSVRRKLRALENRPCSTTEKENWKTIIPGSLALSVLAYFREVFFKLAEDLVFLTTALDGRQTSIAYNRF